MRLRYGLGSARVRGIPRSIPCARRRGFELPAGWQFAQALTDLFVLQKAIYEVGYELANRPDWVEIPLSGIRDLWNEG